MSAVLTIHSGRCRARSFGLARLITNNTAKERVMRQGACAGLVLLGLSTMGSSAQAAISLGTSDTFDQGATLGWSTGASSPNPPVGVATGGPGGSADGYLLMTSNGSASAGGKLISFAGTQWLGDYVSAGVTTINLQANNFGATDLALHLSFVGSGFVSAFTTQAIPVQAGSGWTSLAFDIRPAALTGNPSALGSVTEIRLYHNPASSLSTFGPNIAASLGIDNVTAVPEPQAWLLFGAGLALVGVHAARRARTLSPR